MSEQEQDFSLRLRSLIETVDIANLLSSPIIESIRNLLENSAASLGSGEASVLVREGVEGDLQFLGDWRRRRETARVEDSGG